MVGVDGDRIETTTCPVLLLTPEVEEVFTWFRATHELVSEPGRVEWRRTALPAAGGIAEQDARLMAMLEHMAMILNTQIRGKTTQSHG